MKRYEAILAFIGDFSPVFFITYIVYVGYHLTWWIGLLIFSFLSNLIWREILIQKNPEKRLDLSRETFKISDVKDIGNDVIAYFLSYSITLPTIFFLPASKGLLILAVILILVYVLFTGNKVLLFNPFLSVFGYHEYEIKTVEESTIYVISKEHLEKNTLINVLKINPFIYYYKAVPDTP
ncbi:hypothetical protein [Ferroplasma sp.]|uniref:hypothetical protein n=1 Tax=Ferroplasma sp. TaxID=2591003 RepID=UPI00262EAF10|nr:hypothetical protein [Ferroplasma sp.]